jgi:hypothetical protein
LYWKIRYLDRSDRTFKDRWLFLDIHTLDARTRAAVEFVVENHKHGFDREIVRFRHLFSERDVEALKQVLQSPGGAQGIGPIEYFEDESGTELTPHEVGQILTGSVTAIFVPSGTKQHDLDLMLAEKRPLPVESVSLTSEELRLLGYFVRDLRELLQSALLKDGGGTISRGGALPPLAHDDYHHETAVTDDEIRSFVTIFRRLYMQDEPANFAKAVELFARVVGDHPLGRWVKGVESDYTAHLAGPPEPRPFFGTTPTFNVKRLIDVFIYTQYAHQPDKRRQRQFSECLSQLGGRKNLLAWLFLNHLCDCAQKMGRAGRVVATWFTQYCEHHRITPDVLGSLGAEHAGLGVAEKQEDRIARIFQEKVEDLSLELWTRAGRPEGGPQRFESAAERELKDALRGSGRTVQGS